MDDKKDIGNAFKRRLDNLKKSPNDKVWDNIVNQLDKEKKKDRLIPFWYKIAGVAAIFIFLFFIGNKLVMYYDTKNTITTKDDIFKKIDSIANNKEVITSKQKNSKIDSLESELSRNSKKRNINNSEENAIVKNTVTNKSISNKKGSRIKAKQEVKKIINNNLIATNKGFKSQQNSEIENTKKNKDIKELQTNNKPKSLELLEQNKNKLVKGINKDVVKDEVININSLQKNEEVKNQKQSIQDALKKTEKNIVNDEFDIEDKNPKLKKYWQISIKAAPIFYSSLSNGSSLDPDLSNNPKSADITLSYGIAASYPISKKIRIRTGVNNINLAYNTKQVPIEIGANAQAFSNTGTELSDTEGSPINENFSGDQFDLTQKITYLEVPIELKYQLIKKKIGIDLISGFSTFFLNDDSVLINNNTNIGSVKNLRNLSFSGNFGLGLDYNFNKKFNFNLEPIIKIQFNTYKGNNVDYKPYFFGVYTGFSYRF